MIALSKKIRGKLDRKKAAVTADLENGSEDEIALHDRTPVSEQRKPCDGIVREIRISSESAIQRPEGSLCTPTEGFDASW